jgi:hypothetical protein
MGPLLPNSWPNTAPDWSIIQVSRPGAPTAQDVAPTTLGELCSLATRFAVYSRRIAVEALATPFASPEFMRR